MTAFTTTEQEERMFITYSVTYSTPEGALWPHSFVCEAEDASYAEAMARGYAAGKGWGNLRIRDVSVVCDGVLV